MEKDIPYEKRERWIHTLALLSLCVSTYYLIYRLSTFNLDALTFSIVLYSAEVYGFITTLMFFFMVWKLKKRVPITLRHGLTVDVFITTLNEPPDLLRKTVLGCLKMKYPHKTYLLDDGRRPEVRALAKELGCEYIARPDNRDAKAGNLNYALPRTNGEFIAVFDADHVPQPDFLDKLLGYFNDEKVAFVQIPQDFYNVDSFQHRLTNGKNVWTEQSLFFSLIQPGKDRWNAAFFCGSCAVLRRKALEAIGGFATGTVTEDIHTSIKLHAKGYKSIYHNESLAYGIAAPVLYPFQAQRLRWGQGAMQVFIRDNPLLKKGLTLPQRICYLASMTTYFDGFQRVIYFFSPIIVLFTGLFPISAFNIDFLIRFIPHLGLSLWAYEEISRGFGRTFLIEQYNMVKFYTFIKTSLGLFIKKRLRFKVTPKTEFDKTTIGMLLPQVLIAVGSPIAIIWALSGIGSFKETDRGIIYANIFWAMINTGLAYTVIRYAIRKIQRRRNFRFPAIIPAFATFPNQAKQLVVVEDLHEKGASVCCFYKLQTGWTFPLRLILADKAVEVNGRILNVREARVNGMPIFYHGIGFNGLSREIRDAIIGFNFSYALNRMMGDLSVSEETPFLKLGRMFRGETLQKRDVRNPYHLPGTYRINGAESLPFVTEDLSDHGMRIFTYHDIKEDVISFDLPDEKGWRSLKGRVTWRKEIDFHGDRAWRFGVKFLTGGV
ncbi:MAG: glycosyltransferase [Nitrospirae bacterium]|nr:glycosyltransferase [Nitrospirota bacterium]